MNDGNLFHPKNILSNVTNKGGVKDDDRFACFFPIDIRAPRVLVPITQIPDFSKVT